MCVCIYTYMCVCVYTDDSCLSDRPCARKNIIISRQSDYPVTIFY